MEAVKAANEGTDPAAVQRALDQLTAAQHKAARGALPPTRRRLRGRRAGHPNRRQAQARGRRSWRRGQGRCDRRRGWMKGKQ